MPTANPFDAAPLDPSIAAIELSERQAMVLRALVTLYVEQAGPVASGMLSKHMPTSLSPASIRNTLAELHEARLIDKAHASAGRVPTPLGLSVFVDHLLDLSDLGPQQQELLDRALEGVDAAETPRQTSHLLSEHTRQLGFVMAPRVEHLRMRTLHLVPVAEQRVLAILVTENGGVVRRVFDFPERLTARELEQAAGLLARRVAGRTLTSLRRRLEREREQLRGEADRWLHRVWALGMHTCETEARGEGDDLVIATRIALFDQPEFSDPGRLRGLFAALETNQKLLGLLRQLASADTGLAQVGFSVSLGRILDEPSLRDCALVAMPYGHLPAPDRGRVIAARGRRAGREESRTGSMDDAYGEGDEDGSLGVLGVIGPQRMDYGRVIPLVSYCAELVTRKLLA